MSDNFVQYSPNKKGDDYVCSDIHGCFSDLENELKAIDFDESRDRLFCVGDLVDRGPESERCVEFLDQPWFYSVKGNHEELLINGYRGGLDKYGMDKWRLHRLNGGTWFGAQTDSEMKTIANRLNDLPLVIQVGEYGIVHAEVNIKYKTWDDFVDAAFYGDEDFVETAIWGRDNIRYGAQHVVDGIKKVFVGHTVMNKPKLLGNVHYIDTGAFLKHFENGKSGKLTIIKLEH